MIPVFQSYSSAADFTGRGKLATALKVRCCETSCVCVCVCACARARACVCVCAEAACAYTVLMHLKSDSFFERVSALCECYFVLPVRDI